MEWCWYAISDVDAHAESVVDSDIEHLTSGLTHTLVVVFIIIQLKQLPHWSWILTFANPTRKSNVTQASFESFTLIEFIGSQTTPSNPPSSL